MTDELMLSHSSVSSYWRCHWQWYLGNILRMPGHGNVAMALGTAVHAGIETLFKRPLRAQVALRRSFAKEAKGLSADELAADPDALVDGETMLATYIREVLPSYTPTMVERPFTIRLLDVLWTGIIDNADDNDVRDIKTTAGKTINGKKPVFTPEYYDMQVTGYGLGYEALTGRKPKRYLLDVLKRSGKYQQYERQPRVAEFLDLVRLTSSAIMQRDFSPTGLLNGACATCPYFEVCEYVVRP